MADEDKTLLVHVGERYVAEIPLEVKIDLGADFAETLTDILTAEDSSFVNLAKIAGLDPKTDFEASNLDEVDFTGCGDFFEGANFRRSGLKNTIWGENVSLTGMLLEGADMTGAQGLTEERLAPAYIDETTILPDGISRARVAEMHRALNLPPPPPDNREQSIIRFTVRATLHPKQ